MTNAPCSGIEPRSMDQTVLDLMGAVALQEKALSEVLCAESQKMRAALDLEDLDLGKLLEMNDSAVSLIHAVAGNKPPEKASFFGARSPSHLMGRALCAVRPPVNMENLLNPRLRIARRGNLCYTTYCISITIKGGAPFATLRCCPV